VARSKYWRIIPAERVYRNPQPLLFDVNSSCRCMSIWSPSTCISLIAPHRQSPMDVTLSSGRRGRQVSMAIGKSGANLVHGVG
jgi:hypothetical protein